MPLVRSNHKACNGVICLRQAHRMSPAWMLCINRCVHSVAGLEAMPVHKTANGARQEQALGPSARLAYSTCMSAAINLVINS